MRTALMFFLVLVSACSTHEVKGETTPGVDLSKFATYDWLPAEEERQPEKFANNPETDRYLRRTIDRHLAAAGYQRSAANADLLVTYVTGVTDGLGETHWGKGYGAPTAGRESIAMRPRREVTLIVDLMESETRRVVWRGTARTTFETMENPSDRSSEILDELFKQLPRSNSVR